eukprot:scaffold80784_cov29-Tisochrysis_lutea.AAC.1
MRSGCQHTAYWRLAAAQRRCRHHSPTLLARELGCTQLRLVGQRKVIKVYHRELVEHLADRPWWRGCDAKWLRIPLDFPVSLRHVRLQRVEEAALAVSDRLASRPPFTQPFRARRNELVLKVPA